MFFRSMMLVLSIKEPDLFPAFGMKFMFSINFIRTIRFDTKFHLKWIVSPKMELTRTFNEEGETSFSKHLNEPKSYGFGRT